jgi:site-specific DNA-methyltransferase (adenine-specific)
VIKDRGAIVLFGSQPFTTALGASAIDLLRYSFVWDKKFAGNFVQAKRMPLKTHEDVLVFCASGVSPNYYPQMIERQTPIKKGGNKQSQAIPIAITEASKNFCKKIYTEKYPTTLLTFSGRDGRGLHPTQKPVALLEYLIKTYTLEGETVLDNCMGSGSTGVACLNTGRHFIGIEKDDHYFSVASDRISKVVTGLQIPVDAVVRQHELPLHPPAELCA